MKRQAELELCRRSPRRFLDNFGHVYNATDEAWVPFRLWPEQAGVIQTIHENQLTVALKARQLGFTWLYVGYALWKMVLHPGATVLFFSKRDDEAVEMLDFRLKGMHDRLPEWMRLASRTNDKHEWLLSNDSRAMSFPTTGGRSYTGSLAIIDEADWLDLGRLMAAVKPTIDAGGKLAIVSTVDKAKPESLFKRIYRAARDGKNAYKPIFKGWWARPDRTPEWHEAQKRDIYANTGSLDMLYQEYPASDEEALAANTLDKRIAPEWLRQCYAEKKPLTWTEIETKTRGQKVQAPSLPGLEVYGIPRPTSTYVIGGDVAEGNPTSDDSALTVLDRITGEEVAALAGKFEPGVFGAHLDAIGRWYNNAELMVERNNHGHATILWLKDNSRLKILAGHDKAAGWLSNSKGKALLYDAAAQACRESDCVIHSAATYYQLASIEGATLRAPEGQMDDRADSYALAVVGIGASTGMVAAPQRLSGGVGRP